MNAHFLSTLQWYTMLTGSNWISQLSQGSSTPGKKQYFCDGKTMFWPVYWVNHEYALSEPTVVEYYSADWLHLNTFSSMQYAPPQPQGFSIPGKQHCRERQSFYWIKP